MTTTESVWLLYDHGDLRGVYAAEDLTRADAEALVRQAEAEDGHRVSRHAIEVLRVPVRSASGE